MVKQVVRDADIPLQKWMRPLILIHYSECYLHQQLEMGQLNSVLGIPLRAEEVCQLHYATGLKVLCTRTEKINKKNSVRYWA